MIHVYRDAIQSNFIRYLRTNTNTDDLLNGKLSHFIHHRLIIRPIGIAFAFINTYISTSFLLVPDASIVGICWIKRAHFFIHKDNLKVLLMTSKGLTIDFQRLKYI